MSESKPLYTYSRPHPSVTVDLAIFTVDDAVLKLLVVRRGMEPFKGNWALPGGFVRIDESLEAAAARELAEETGLTGAYLEQVGAFGDPRRDPRERVISIAYFAIVSAHKRELRAGSDAAEARWCDVANLPKLAFDHPAIVEAACARLAEKARRTALATEFLGPEFTLTELQRVHEALLGQQIDKRNFRKWVSSVEHLRSTGRVRRGDAHRPALLFRRRTTR